MTAWVCVCVGGHHLRHQGHQVNQTKQGADVKNCMLSGSCNLKENTPPNRKNLWEWQWKKEELRSNHFFTVLMVLQTWIIHLKCKNDWKWITSLDDSIWYGGKIRTDCIGTTLQRRVLCDWALAHSVESLHRANLRHTSGTKTLWEYFGYEWGDAQVRSLCNLRRNCRTLVASKGHPQRTCLHSNWQQKELNKEL